MNQDDFILEECKRICIDYGIGEEKSDSLSELALIRFRCHELRNAKEVAKWIHHSAQVYKRVMKKTKADPIKR